MHPDRSTSRRAWGITALLAALLLLVPLSAAAQGLVGPFVSEFHYDNDGADEGEFVEVTGSAGIDLAGWTVALYNGTSSQRSVYATVALSGVIDDEAGGLGALAFDTGQFQNGAPDGFALVDPDDTVRQFLSYEGTFEAASGPAAGMTSTDVGVAEGSSTPIGHSLQFVGGAWTGPLPATRGDLNEGGGSGDDPVAVINEFSASTTGPDVEYVELLGDPSTDYSDLTVLQAEGDSGSGNFGLVIGSYAVGTTDAAGFALVDGPSPALQNGTLSLLLVRDWTGETDVTGDLGTVIDSVGVNDGDGGDTTWVETELDASFDGGANTFPPGGASRIPDGADTDTTDDWVRNDFDLAGIEAGEPVPGEAYNTPGAPNQWVEPPVLECGADVTSIGAVQGAGDASPLVGETVEIEGVVVGDFQSGGFDGYYLQDAGDGDPATSDGVFVYDDFIDAPVDRGDVVRVRGEVSEFFGLTEVTADAALVCAAGAALPDPVELTLPIADHEPYEGMHVTLPQSLAILEYFNYDRFGQIVVGTDRQYQPTAVFEPGSDEALALAEFNATHRITIDDGRSFQNPSPPIHPNGDPFTLDNRFRGGDLVTNATGVLDWRFSTWAVQPTTGADFEVANPRPDVPEVGGDVQVAAFNVLNYFTTIDEGDARCPAPEVGPDGGCRGADTSEEFTRQKAKIVAALAELDADVVGLMEIENNEIAVEDLVDGLNAELGDDVYAAISTGPIGTDAIKVGLIYKPAVVKVNGDFAVLDSSVDPRFNDDKNRPVLAQTFTGIGTGGDITVAVNHLKSKGSSCDDIGDPTDPDGQGNCNGTRTLAAEALADWLATQPTGVDTDSNLIIGDLNSYDEEDPIDVLVGAGYVDTLEQFQGEEAYTYVFDGQLGHLDYVMAAPGFAKRITGAAAWHSNTDEPDLIDYDMSFKRDAEDALYAPDPWRASDHDAVVVGVDLGKPNDTPGKGRPDETPGNGPKPRG